MGSKGPSKPESHDSVSVVPVDGVLLFFIPWSSCSVCVPLRLASPLSPALYTLRAAGGRDTGVIFTAEICIYYSESGSLGRAVCCVLTHRGE